MPMQQFCMQEHWSIHCSKQGDCLHRRIETPKGTGIIMAIERLLTGSIRERVQDLMSTEDLIIESFKDIVKDELKAHIRNKIEEDPDLHAEIKEAVAYYFHQKARSVYAELKATRAATRLGLRLLPDELQGEVGEALIGLFEKELGTLLDKAL